MTNKKQNKDLKNTIQEKANAVKKKTKKVTKLTEVKGQLSELQDKHLRLKAEFENFRRRKDKEISRFLQYGGENVIKKLLPILDDFDRLSVAIGKDNIQVDESISKGINMVLTKIDKWLTELEIKPFGEEGDLLDPELHDAMTTNSNDKYDDNQILDVFEKGYQYKDRVIRHAKVIVNKK